MCCLIDFAGKSKLSSIKQVFGQAARASPPLPIQSWQSVFLFPCVLHYPLHTFKKVVGWQWLRVGLPFLSNLQRFLRLGSR
jgi:predicted alpha/beta hydrolase